MIIEDKFVVLSDEYKLGMLVLDKISLSFVELSLLKDNVVLVNYLNEDSLNVEKGILIVEAINKLTHRQPTAAIHNMGDKYVFNTDALRFMWSQLTPESHHYVARAIVATNSAERLATTNFINFYKPIIPTRLFNTIDEAYNWVEGVLDSMR